MSPDNQAIERDQGIGLELIDMGIEVGAAFPNHDRMYEAIAPSDIIIYNLPAIIALGYRVRASEEILGMGKS